jgi:hypothetical protein
MQKSETHFEQIPVELVKKIAKEIIANDNVEGNDGVVTTIPTSKLKSHRLPALRRNGTKV